VNWLFRRHFWILNLVFLCIAAAIFGKIFTTVLGYWASKKIPEKPVARPMISRETGPTFKNFEKASERNLFAAKRESLLEEEEDEVDTGRWQDAGPTGLPLKLIGTRVFDDPFSSKADIADLSSGRTGIFAISDCEEYHKQNSPEIETVFPPESWQLNLPCNDVFGLAKVVRIEEFRVYILNQRTHRFEFISSREGDLGRKERPMQKTEAEEEGSGVRKVGPMSYEIDQKEFDKAMTNVAKLLMEAKALPETDNNGNQIGFKIYYLKEGSLFQKIGIERDDVLTRINGNDLNSLEKALPLFGKLRSANHFTIDLKRGGRSLTLDYSVVK
jgi:general secretion pathway protein C